MGSCFFISGELKGIETDPEVVDRQQTLIRVLVAVELQVNAVPVKQLLKAGREGGNPVPDLQAVGPVSQGCVPFTGMC